MGHNNFGGTLVSAVTEISRMATVCHTEKNQSPPESSSIRLIGVVQLVVGQGVTPGREARSIVAGRPSNQ